MDLIKNGPEILVVKTLAAQFDQFEPSQLQPQIIKATGCTKAQAADWGEHHCNLLSAYFGWTAGGLLKDSYAGYFKTMLDAGACEKGGMMLWTKDKVAALFGIPFETPINYMSDFNVVKVPDGLDEFCFYQIKIINSSHYMVAWIENIGGVKKFMIADTHDRGIGVPAIGAYRIDEKHFSWIIKLT